MVPYVVWREGRREELCYYQPSTKYYQQIVKQQEGGQSQRCADRSGQPFR